MCGTLMPKHKSSIEAITRSHRGLYWGMTLTLGSIARAALRPLSTAASMLQTSAAVVVCAPARNRLGMDVA